MADADYEWLETHLPSVAAQMTLPEQREVLRVIEGAQSAAWESGRSMTLSTLRNLGLGESIYAPIPNPYRNT